MSFTTVPRKYNALPSVPDIRNYRLTRPRHYRLPSESDLAMVAPLPSIRDQGAEGSCTGFGITSAWEIEKTMQTRQQAFVPSPAAEYWWEREIEGTTNQDPGAQIGDGLSVLLHTGVIPETEFPYVAGQYATPPPLYAKQDAAANRIQSYTQLTSLEEILYTLATKHVVIIGFAVYQSFEQVGSNGMVPMPSSSEKMLGGHCTKLVGYNKRNRRLRMPNQWGTSWANNGYAWLPFDYCAFKPNSPVFEAWTISL